MNKRITFLLFALLTSVLSWQGMAQAGSTCEDPLVVTSMPFNDSGNTSTYGNNYAGTDVPPVAPGAITNGTGSTSYISGDDVVYSYTAGENGSITINTTNDDDWIGLWVFTGCPFSSTVGYHVATSGATRSVPDLPVTAGETYYIIISTWPAPQSTDYTISITGTDVADPPTCLKPTALNSTNVTTTTADIGWTAGESETSWNVSWGTSGFTVGGAGELGSETVTTASYQITGLTSSTPYQVYVQADCSGGDLSYWSGPHAFRTACDIISVLPYTENFDTYGTGAAAFPACWERVTYTTGSNIWPSIVSGNATSAPNSLKFQSLTTTPTYAVSPPFAEDIQNLRVTFQLKREGTSSGTIDVGVMSDANDISTFELVQTINPADNVYHEYVIDMNQVLLSGSGNSIALRQNSASSSWYYWLDDFEVDLVPSCFEPTALATSAITGTTADISWTAGNTETSWNISWGTPGYTPGDTNEIATDITAVTNYQITGLTANTGYDVYVQSDCDLDGTSYWAGPLNVYTGYCIPTNTGNSGHIASVTIDGDAGQDISNLNSGPGLNGDGYSDFSAQTVVVSPEGDITYSVTLQSANTAGLKIWIDWNNDLMFDETTELVFQSSGYSNTYAGSITMPVGVVGSHRMRIGSSYTPSSGPANACAHTGQGEYEDYTLDITTLAACTEAVAGTVVGDTAMEVCSLTPFSMSVTGNSEPADGLIRTWQSSPAGAGTWTNLDVASSTISISGIDVATDYRYHVECTNGDVDDSDVIAVSLNPNPSECYCTPEGINTARYIDNFSTTGGIQNISNLSSGFSAGGYGDFTAMTVEGNPGDELSFTADVLGGTAGFRIWVDWNKDGAFDATEEVVYNSTSYENQHIGSFTIPMGAATGETRMRVVSNWSLANGEVDPCATAYNNGEFEDYTLSVAGASGPFPSPYCDITDAGDVWVEEITSIDVDGVNVITNTNTTDPLVDHTDVVVDVTASGTYNLSVEGNTYGDFDTNIVAFIDWNQNEMLDDAGEIYELGTLSNSTGSDGVSVNMDILVPAGAVLGETRIRITKTYFDDLSPAIVTPCGIQFDPFGQGVEVGYGQAIDFTLNVMEGSTDDCTGTPEGGIATVNPINGEVNTAYTVAATGFTSGNGLTYQWQSNTDAAGWVNEGVVSDTYAAFMATAPATSGVVVEWRLEVTCVPSSETSYSEIATFTTIEPAIYCIPVLDCNDGDNITNVTFQEINNTTTCSASGYGDYTAMIATVQSGASFPISVTVGDGWDVESASVWVDFDNSGSFEENEFFYIGTGTDETLSGSIAIPAGAADGNYRMRVRVAAVPGTDATWDMACNEDQAYGETEDYTVTIDGAASGDECTGTPEGGIATVNPETGGVNTDYTVSATDYTSGNGLTYLWQSNIDGAGWVNEGVVSDTYADFMATAPATSGVVVEWRLEVTCTFSTETAYSEIATFTTTEGAMYCIPVLDCNDDDSITNVTFQEIDNTTTCSVDGYGDYTAMTATVQSGGTYPISVSVGGGWAVESVSVWIDFDNSQTFDEGEFYFVGTGSAEALSADISIPAGVADGNYRMRVRVAAVGESGATWDMACDETQGFGETEDYTVTVDGTVGVEDYSNLNFSYYPNPMSEVLYVTANQNIESVSAYNVLGQQVLNNNQFADGKVDVSSLPTGTFIFRVTFEGGLEENFKVIKE